MIINNNALSLSTGFIKSTTADRYPRDEDVKYSKANELEPLG